MTDNVPGAPHHQGSPEPDPWASTPQPAEPQPWESGYNSTGYPAGGQPPAYPPAGYPPAASGWAPAPGASTPGAPAPVGSTPQDANPVAALFDFSFTRFATPGLVKIVYILQVVAAVGSWLLWVFGSFASAGTFGASPAAGVLVLLFGWIPVLLSIAFTRFVLEGIVALIRIHDRVAEIADAGKGTPSA